MIFSDILGQVMIYMILTFFNMPIRKSTPKDAIPESEGLNLNNPQ